MEPDLGANSLRFYTSNGTYGDEMAILPPIDENYYPINTLQVSFYARALNTSYTFKLVVGVLSNPASLSSFTPMDTLTITSTTHTLYEIPLGHYTGAGNYIGILAPKTTTGMNYGYVDNITVDLMPTCPKPTNLTASNITTTSIDLSWFEDGTANNWVVEYGISGFTQGTGSTVQVTGTPSTTITGLSASMTYDFYVKSDCGGGDVSPWSIVGSGSTLCDAITQLPYTQNFDAYGVSSSTTTSPGPMPACWERINTNSSPRPFCNTSTSYNAAGSVACLYFFASSGCYNIAVMPEVDASIPLNTLKLNFKYRGLNSYTTPLSVGVMTDPTNANTYVELATIPFDATLNNWVNREISFANYTGTGRFIAFKNGSSSASTYAMIDDLVLDYDTTLVGSCTAPTGVTASNLTDLSPNTGYTFKAFATTASGTTFGSEMTFTTQNPQQDTCPSPTNVTVTGVTATTAVVAWTQPDNTATSWDLLYKESAADSWYTVTTSNNPYTLAGLSGESSYDVRVIAHCTNGIPSDPSATITFMTVGIDDYTLDNTVNVYPNPTTGMIQVMVSEGNVENVTLYDACGKLLGTETVNSTVANVDLTGYAKGTYFVRVTTDKGVVTKRVVKQ